jgi:putative membrane protein
MSDYEKTNNGADLLKGIAAGAIGGLVGAWAMNEFQSLKKSLSGGGESWESEYQQGFQEQGGGKDRQPESITVQSEPSTVKAAEVISEGVFKHELTASEERQAGRAVHYAIGAGSGAFYGAAAEVLPVATIGMGVPFGAAVWLLADETAVSALGLAKSPLAYPAASHAGSFAAHLVYGVSTEIVRRLVRKAL